jgi:hypothetical protein
MKPEILIERIKAKAHAPDLFETDRCLVWTGAHLPGGPLLRVNWDHMRHVDVRPSSKIMFQGKMTSVPRVLHILETGTTQPFRAKQTCSTHLCINPRHWVFKPIGSAPPEFTYNPDDWTAEEAREFVTRFHATGDHNLLADIPKELLHEVFPDYRPAE